MNLNRSSSRKPAAYINITPLVDVLLILLVVLMLSMPMYVKRLPVELPNTSVGGTPALVNSLRFSLSASGALSHQDKPVSLQDAVALVSPNSSIELAIDKDASYAAIAEVLSQLNAKQPRELVLLSR